MYVLYTYRIEFVAKFYIIIIHIPEKEVPIYISIVDINILQERKQYSSMILQLFPLQIGTCTAILAISSSIPHINNYPYLHKFWSTCMYVLLYLKQNTASLLNQRK